MNDVLNGLAQGMEEAGAESAKRDQLQFVTLSDAIQYCIIAGKRSGMVFAGSIDNLIPAIRHSMVNSSRREDWLFGSLLSSEAKRELVATSRILPWPDGVDSPRS